MTKYLLSQTMRYFLILLVLALTSITSGGELIRELEISEGVPIGTKIGYIGDGHLEEISGPPYLIVPVTGSAVDSDLIIDQTTGEIRTKVVLDREKRSSYSLVAIPLSGDNIKVVVRVLDENDNAPKFPTGTMFIEFPENTPRDVKRTLHPARDLDLGIFNTQKYNIVSGNINNAFRLSSHRERDGVLYLDLQINGFLDRETISAYSLLIEALDGGNPPLKGEMFVNISIQDINDCPPNFNQSRYFASIPENATIGTNILQVFATDLDFGENGLIEYSINRRQSDKENMFRIDSKTGLIAVNKPLDYETRELHELVIVAKDHGLQPLEATTFVSIRVTNVNDNLPEINVIFLSDDATAKISEASRLGEFVARISVHDPDSKTEYSNINVTLKGGQGHFGLTTRDNIVYLVIVSLPLDRESTPNYTLTVFATDNGTPPLHASKTFELAITDINDNPPEFDKDIYHATVMEISDPGTSVIQVLAKDLDEGKNGQINYFLKETPDTHSGWFQIDERSGLITTKVYVDCETNPVPQLTVIASDNGFPPLSSTATVLVTIQDVNDNEAIFDQSFYNVSIAENVALGRCILKVSATDPDCGVNAMVNYTLGESYGKLKEFEVRPTTGEICVNAALDFETRNVFEFPVVATDRGGLSTTAMVKIQLTDINDNKPIFYPVQYNVSLREENNSQLSSIPVVQVQASDPDSGKFGIITYKIISGNENGLFRIDRLTGEIFVARPNLLSSKNQPYHKLNISATDGGGLRSVTDSEVYISVIDSRQRPPIFEKTKYSYEIKEDARIGSYIGNVKATVSDTGDRRPIRYSISSGDPDGYFTIDPISGAIKTAEILDHEAHSNVLLNVQATSGDPPSYGHTQVNIEILDVNDNKPEFESPTVRISIPENAELSIPLYSAHARDRDSGKNGEITYKIVTGSPNSSGLFAIDKNTGHLSLLRKLDYESVQRHSLLIVASDKGTPQLQSNLTILVEVQDCNDNLPVFEQNEYSVKVLENIAVNSQIIQVTAIDLDTGNNARITYKLVHPNISSSNEDSDIFGVFPNSGWIYLKNTLDRENKDRYSLTIAALDNGTPSSTATAKILVTVLDANDNAPKFTADSYQFSVEENQKRGTIVGKIKATDLDIENNAVIRYSLIPGNSSFDINPVTGEISTKEPLDREYKASYDLIGEAKDQGIPSKSSRVQIKIKIIDLNDNDPEIIDPQGDVVSVREEQPIGTEVVKIRAVDNDEGINSTITYSILKSRESDGYGVFTIDPITGVIKTRKVLDHEERTIFRLAIAATDSGKPSRQTIKNLKVEILDLNDNRPTFTSSSLLFHVPENVPIGHIVGSIAQSSLEAENLIPGSYGNHISYSLISLLPNDKIASAFEIDRKSGSLVVAQRLDREIQSEYRLEIRALDISALNNPQSSAVTIKIVILDVNDNYPKWKEDPVIFHVEENMEIGGILYNFTAYDPDEGLNGEIRYGIKEQIPKNDSIFSLDSLTGALTLVGGLDFEEIAEYNLVITATDQSGNISERLTSTLTVKIQITDSNDQFPKFIFPISNFVNVPGDLGVGSAVTNIIAVDNDLGDNGRVSYIISGGSGSEFFSLGYDTGILTLAKPFQKFDSKNSKSENQKFLLNITASDHGNPNKKTSTVLQINIRGDTDGPPKFMNDLYEAKISEDVPVGSYVIKVDARAGLDAGTNLTYSIPEGFSKYFEISPKTGVVTTKSRLDREEISEHKIPIYVTGVKQGLNPYFDLTFLKITILDVNDFAPEFKAGSCYPIYVPENEETSIIHTVVAMDMDSGKNGEISYSITGGNIGNKFQIDSKTGELSSKSLDREVQSRYTLTITAMDHGKPNLQNSCNISIRVDDQNDNEPKFDSPNYSTIISEDIALDTSILRVVATDMDLGTNSKIIYSLTNETNSLFRIDNKTGIITTTGNFDRESRKNYDFYVIATDQGKYLAKSAIVPIKIIISDVNDNSPTFSKYPFKQKIPAFTPPGQNLIKIQAQDLDEGINSEIVYSLLEHDGKFRINPNTGILTASQSLASENGKIIYLKVKATDRGNPPKSSLGLVELQIGEINPQTPRLVFQNETYYVNLQENSAVEFRVVQVSAVRTDGRKQKIIYTIGKGNEDGTFWIDEDTGIIFLKNSTNLDYEKNHEINLIIEAKTENFPYLFAYCEVVIRLADQNDNGPKFTQNQYTSYVYEGNSKSTYVMQVKALDFDQGKNSKILYHIVDGNHDNAFIIEPAFSGIIKTNIVLDREIRDQYRLTVIATDQGVPQMTGTTRVKINILDINDNRPTFPPHRAISISEGTEVGTVLTSISANDVDTFPPLTYFFSPQNEPEVLKMFGLDYFSGRLVLKKSLDYEKRKEFQLNITASDKAHEVSTILTIKVTDENDLRPQFEKIAYHAILPEGRSNLDQDLIQVNATDLDSSENSILHYSFLNPVKGFKINEKTGLIKVNQSNLPQNLKDDIYLTVVVSDNGKPKLTSVCSVRVKINGGTENSPNLTPKQYKINIPENSPKGTTILELPSLGIPNSKFQNIKYTILEGNEDKKFDILNPNGIIFLTGKLDREKTEKYNLKLILGDKNLNTENSNSNIQKTVITIEIRVQDYNDNPPIFEKTYQELILGENTPVGTKITDEIYAYDLDLIEKSGPQVNQNQNSTRITYSITSGNDKNLFKFQNGALLIQKGLDFDTTPNILHLIIRACDAGSRNLGYSDGINQWRNGGTNQLHSGGTNQLNKTPGNKIGPQFCSYTKIKIILEDSNDNPPIFPISEYLGFLGENEVIGTSIFQIRAFDLDQGIFGRLNYTISDDKGKFKVNSETGEIFSNEIFDFERQNKYFFNLKATDFGGKSTLVRVRIDIESRDEFYPQFTEKHYNWEIGSKNGFLPAGYILGNIRATDRDKGIDGRIIYQFTTPNSNFKINRTTGAVLTKRKIDLENLGTDLSLVVIASSGKKDSLTNMTVIEINLDPQIDLGTNLLSKADAPALSDWAIGLLTGFFLLIAIFGAIFTYFYLKNKKNTIIKPNLTKNNDFQINLPPENNEYLPKYNDLQENINININNQPISEISGSEQSSGRGSADDDDDIEIRMINEQINRRSIDHNIDTLDQDNISEMSVDNTQDYLKRLGINSDTKNDFGNKSNLIYEDRLGIKALNTEPTEFQSPKYPTMDTLRISDEEGTSCEPDITNLIYAKLNDVATSERGGISEVSEVQPLAMGAFSEVQPSMNGSLSSIVHSEEELTGSYNWDYLLDWGPQYQPLAHVFSEIARLKDDTVSVQSAQSGNSSVKSKNSVKKNLPPPLLTNVAPRTITIPTLASRNPHSSHIAMPRSPISHEAGSSSFGAGAALSPSFSPSLSPLATKSPSISPHHVVSLPRQPPNRTRTIVDTELQI